MKTIKKIGHTRHARWRVWCHHYFMF